MATRNPEREEQNLSKSQKLLDAEARGLGRTLDLEEVRARGSGSRGVFRSLRGSGNQAEELPVLYSRVDGTGKRYESRTMILG